MIQDGRIAPSSSAPAERIDCSGCLIFPGLVVGHTHLYSGLAAGMPAAPPPANFLQILQRVWWRLDQALDAESLRASAQVAALAAVRSGASCLIDHHESPRFIDGSLDIIAQALEEIGLRACLCYGATDRHGAQDAQAGLRESERFLSEKRAHIMGAFGLHAPFTASDETLERAAALGKDAWLHLHAAEGPDDQVNAQSRWSQRLIPKLNEMGLLGPKTLLAHTVDLQEAEAEQLLQSGVWVSLQARSNMNNGVGYATRMLDLESPRMALGTDGVDNDMLRELQAAFFKRREHLGPSAWPDAAQLLSGSQRLASAMFEQALDSLAPQSPADLTIVRYEPPTPLTAESLGAHLIFGFAGAQVRDVFVHGNAILRDSQITTVDERMIFEHAREIAPDFWRRIEALPWS